MLKGLAAVLLLAPGVGAAASRPAGDVEFRRDVFPLLKARCFDCHAGRNSKAGVRLDFRPEILGETTGHPLAVPGRSARSILVHLVSRPEDAEDAMPPKGPRLTAEEVGVLRAWIDGGVSWDEALLPSTLASDHWAFQAVHRPDVPPSGRGAWVRNPVDAFVSAAHEERGVKPAPEASRRVLIRRLSLDLTGLPPSREEVRRFLDDRASGAYERLVDRLLASPHYGERWGRHWLDVARYADSEGYESNHPRPYMWRYRDYVVDSFNRDKPFDRFVREQIAGDEMSPYADEHLIATGFLAGARLSSNEEDKAMQRNDVLVDVVNATGAALLGLTMKCAQCHSHKFDPISQRDYYRLMGYFVKGQPNNLVLKGAELWKAFDAQKPAEYDALFELKQVLYEKGRQGFIANAKKSMSPGMLAALDIPDAERSPEEYELARRADLLFQATPGGYERFIPETDRKLYGETKKRLEHLLKTMKLRTPQTWGFYSPSTGSAPVTVLPMKAFYPLPYDEAELRSAVPYLLIRGDVHRRGPKLTPGWPVVFGKTPGSGRSRLALADWLTSRENPLVSRVWVNRIWQYHFGRGIVTTPGDFGVRGARPSHPKLLDWLAVELMENGWSTKHLHRVIVTSATYRQSSRGSGATLDPDNRFLWHWRPRRLEAETIRDSALAVSGELERVLGGAYASGEEARSSVRRSLYLMQKRDALSAFQSMFDGPLANESCGQRDVSTVALQPLFMLNNPFMVKRSRALAARMNAANLPARMNASNLPARIDGAFEQALGRLPAPDERDAARAFLGAGDEDERFVQFCHALLNLNEFVYIE